MYIKLVRTLLLLALMTPCGAAGFEGRRIVPIIGAQDGQASTSQPAGAPAAVDRAECEQFTRELAQHYTDTTLEDYLAEDFPNRAALLDAVARSRHKADNVELDIDAIESIRVLPWQRTDGGAWLARCIVDLRARLSWDDPNGGGRTVYPSSRMRWHLGVLQED